MLTPDSWILIQGIISRFKLKTAKMASKPYAAGISFVFRVIVTTLVYQPFHYFR